MIFDATSPDADAIDAGYDVYRLRKLVTAVAAFVATADLSAAPAAELMQLRAELDAATMCVGGLIEVAPATVSGPDLPF